MEKELYIKYVKDYIHLTALYLNKKEADIDVDDS